jgi:hypothetical protein
VGADVDGALGGILDAGVGGSAGVGAGVGAGAGAGAGAGVHAGKRSVEKRCRNADECKSNGYTRKSPKEGNLDTDAIINPNHHPARDSNYTGSSSSHQDGHLGDTVLSPPKWNSKPKCCRGHCKPVCKPCQGVQDKPTHKIPAYPRLVTAKCVVAKIDHTDKCRSDLNGWTKYSSQVKY